MSLQAKLQAIAHQIRTQGHLITNEQVTKTSLIQPFFAALGYNVTDPSEFFPEFTCDVGLKKGEKVDYAILNNGEVRMLIECKPLGAPLESKHMSQLVRYFTACSAHHTTPTEVRGADYQNERRVEYYHKFNKLAILTDGRHYKFYTDLVRSNVMDLEPFFHMDLLGEGGESALPFLNLLTKDNFDIGKILELASEMSATRMVKKYLVEQVLNPSEEFIAFILKQLNMKRVTKAEQGILKDRVAQTIQDIIEDGIKARLKAASEQPPKNPLEGLGGEKLPKQGVVTTEEELDGYRIVKAVLARNKELVARLGYKDTTNYFGIIIDDSPKKTVCRLYFNGAKKYIEVFDSEQSEKILIEDVTDIYEYQERVIASAKAVAS